MGYNRSYLNQNVLDAAIDRVRWVYREFKNVYVSFSGGKDSTVCLNLALQVAEEMDRLPVRVLFVDQEAEWGAVIDYIRQISQDPRVDMRWLQVPFKFTNSTATKVQFLEAWQEGREWMREKEPHSVKRNFYGTDRFKKLFSHYLAYHHGTQPVASLVGMRCEESPGRTMGLTGHETYKGMTWGGIQSARKRHFMMCPLYDWGYRDVWKAIHDHNWPYTKIYDWQYQHGIPVNRMRVSSLNHELAIGSLSYMQVMEPETWERLQIVLPGVHTTGNHLYLYQPPDKLPFMFKDWVEYRDYLLVNITEPGHQEKLRGQFAKYDKMYEGSDVASMVHLRYAQIYAILRNDLEETILGLHLSATRSHRRTEEANEAHTKAIAALTDFVSLSSDATHDSDNPLLE